MIYESPNDNIYPFDPGAVNTFNITIRNKELTVDGFVDASGLPLDPVSVKEINRNNGMQKVQGNRNPFIDYPILAEYLWGTKANDIFLFVNAVASFDPAFIPGVSDGAASQEEALEEIPVSRAAQIIIENGQLLILREGAVYSVTGARIR